MKTESPQGRRYAGTSANERQSERLARLLEAGTQVIGVEGFQAATVKSVCSQAKLTERYFYESFASREALLLAVYQKSAGQLTDRLREAVQDLPPSPEIMVHAAVHAAFSWLKKDPRQARILYFEMLGSNESLRPVFLASTKNFANLVLALLSPLMAPETKKNYDKEVMAAAIVGAFNHLVLWWAWSDYDKPLDTMVDSSVAIFMALIHPTLKESSKSRNG